MTTRKHHRWRHVLIGVVVVGILGILGASMYFYQYAFVPAKKDFLSTNTPRIQQNAETWLKHVHKETWHQQAAGADLTLVADYIPAAKATTKTVVIAHGYMGKKEDMAARIKMFHDSGFNVLAPDDRGHGQSQGHYIGYGWPDRLDYLQWLHLLLKQKGQDQQIALYGESMGGATVMYLSGTKLPQQVQVIVEDCGYTSIIDELAYQAKSMYHLPKWPLVPAVGAYASLKTGYNVFAADARRSLAQNTRPILFIHGTKDTFVPTWMAKENYAATTAKKKLWLVKGAKHAQSFCQDPARYQRKVVGWIEANLH
ncbi:alpha/beta hydrolase [Lacticaseibacillus baoqingensis]|uniref:Alpha/beta hydrolase n=1 Tax=Lacticaseibacillus baoqingensis TaxID=2486013 RepID=A0ABW4E3X6_9LACO|nr:alpha/beta hydrolase [Lacticaseibacillus baoqingensis]